MTRYLGHLVACLALGVWVIYSALQTGGIIGSYPDAYVSVWSIFRYSQDYDLYYTKLAFAPTGSSLLLHNLSEFVTLPASFVALFLGATITYNLLVAVVTVLNFYAGSLMTGRISSRLPIRLYCGILLAIHPFILGHICGGHINLFTAFPLYMLVYFALAERANPVIIAGFCAAVFYTDYYQAWVAALTLAAIFLAKPNMKLFLGGLGGLILCLPKLIPTLSLLSSGSYSANHNPALHSLPISALFLPHPMQFISFYYDLILNSAETGAYFGLTFFFSILALLILRRWRFILPILFFILLSFGPFSAWTPYRLLSLSGIAPPVPARFVLGALIFAILGLAEVTKEIKNTKVLSIVILLSLLEFLPKTLPTLPTPKAEILSFQDNQWNSLPLLDLTTPELAMYNQTVHHHPIVNGFLARRPKVAEKRVKILLRKWKRYCNDPTPERITSLQNEAVGGVVFIGSACPTNQ